METTQEPQATIQEPLFPGADDNLFYIGRMLGRMEELRKHAAYLRRLSRLHVEITEAVKAELLRMLNTADFLIEQIQSAERALLDDGGNVPSPRPSHSAKSYRDNIASVRQNA